jgi:TldD protein
VKRALWLTALLTGVSVVLLSQNSADDDVILRAMRAEMERSRQLKIVGGGDPPYFISYGVTEADTFRTAAQLGSVIIGSRNRFRSPTTEVRVGSYEFDHTGHIFSGAFTGTRFDSDSWPLDDLYGPIREALWLSTDRAFKAGLESISRKRGALNNAAPSTEKLADYWPAPPVKSIQKINRKKIDEARWSAQAARLSALLKGMPEIHNSSVEGQALEGVTYLLNSEGTTLRYPDNLGMVTAKAEGQAADGMFVRDAVGFQSGEIDKMPPESEMQKGIEDMAANLRVLLKAPVGAAFSGPVLFEPQAAAQLLAQLLGDNLRFPRKPVAEPGRPVNFLPSELEIKMGSRILPDWIDVVDDPKQTAWRGKPLIGFYEFDLEGVPGQTVSVVEKGVLKNILTTRQPVKGFSASNGHARLPGGYGARSAAISNLFIKATQSAPLAKLKQQLIDQCKQRGKPYGMLVRKLDYPFSAGQAELQSLAQGSQQSGGSVRPVSPPVLLYRVYPDGREELVRGLRFRGISTRSLRDIQAASEELALFEYINNAAPLALLGAGGYLAPTSVISPALLFEELELELPQDQLPKRPAVPPPGGQD